ncbi:hypothetical protein [Streptosporangium vulgare]|uniref:hypothetical protein n=1 Tax=Streptosporangium vulgare TaxID=46190 RepID=UPI0031DAAA15
MVTLTPGSPGVIADPGAARCSCLLAPRCLHRAAVLSACPVADPALSMPPDLPADLPGNSDSGAGTSTGAGPGPEMETETEPGSRTGSGTVADRAAGLVPAPGGKASPLAGAPPAADLPSVPAPVPAPVQVLASGPNAGQTAAASGLWAAAAGVLAGGVPGAGAVPQAELLRAAHTARVAGLHRAEAAALRVVRELRAARARHDGHRLADLVSALRELLLTAGRLAAADPDPALVGTARRAYRRGEGLRVYGVCREPVISATGYGGVVTHLVAEDGRWFSVADVRPGGSARARGAATATVALGAAALDHAQLARRGLLISGATISPDGRLGAGRGVRANPVAGLSWSEGPLAALFARPLATVADAVFSGTSWSDPRDGGAAEQPVGCDLEIVGAEGDRLLARELPPPTERDRAGSAEGGDAGNAGAADPARGGRLPPRAGPCRQPAAARVQAGAAGAGDRPVGPRAGRHPAPARGRAGSGRRAHAAPARRMAGPRRPRVRPPAGGPPSAPRRLLVPAGGGRVRPGPRGGLTPVAGGPSRRAGRLRRAAGGRRVRSRR